MSGENQPPENTKVFVITNSTGNSAGEIAQAVDRVVHRGLFPNSNNIPSGSAQGQDLPPTRIVLSGSYSALVYVPNPQWARIALTARHPPLELRGRVASLRYDGRGGAEVNTFKIVRVRFVVTGELVPPGRKDPRRKALKQEVEDWVVQQGGQGPEYVNVLGTTHPSRVGELVVKFKTCEQAMEVITQSPFVSPWCSVAYATIDAFREFGFFVGREHTLGPIPIEPPRDADSAHRNRNVCTRARSRDPRDLQLTHRGVHAIPPFRVVLPPEHPPAPPMPSERLMGPPPPGALALHQLAPAGAPPTMHPRLQLHELIGSIVNAQIAETLRAMQAGRMAGSAPPLNLPNLPTNVAPTQPLMGIPPQLPHQHLPPLLHQPTHALPPLQQQHTPPLLQQQPHQPPPIFFNNPPPPLLQPPQQPVQPPPATAELPSPNTAPPRTVGGQEAQPMAVDPPASSIGGPSVRFTRRQEPTAAQRRNVRPKREPRNNTILCAGDSNLGVVKETMQYMEATIPGFNLYYRVKPGLTAVGLLDRMNSSLQQADVQQYFEDISGTLIFTLFLTGNDIYPKPGQTEPLQPDPVEYCRTLMHVVARAHECRDKMRVPPKKFTIALCEVLPRSIDGIAQQTVDNTWKQVNGILHVIASVDPDRALLSVGLTDGLRAATIELREEYHGKFLLISNFNINIHNGTLTEAEGNKIHLSKRGAQVVAHSLLASLHEIIRDSMADELEEQASTTTA